MTTPAPPTTRRITRDTLLNVAGMGLPLLAALVCIPLLLARLGVERFGVLTLVWAVSSYFGLFDLGLGRVLAQKIARAWQLRQHRRCGPLVGTALAALALLGASAAVLMAAGAPALSRLIGGSGDTQQIEQAVMAMAFMTPAALLTAGLRGVLEARGAFAAVNLLRLPLGLFNFIGPALMAALAEPGLGAIAWLLCAGRWLAAVAHAVVAKRLLGQACGGWWPSAGTARRLAPEAGWMTLSSLASPLMGYADRLLLGLAGSTAALAYYVTPLEMIGRLAIVPAALTTVLLPAFSAALAARHGTIERPLYDRSVLALFCLLWPACAGLALFAHELLSLWLGATFATASAPLLQVFAVGTLINALAYVPAALLLGAGQARRVALIHLLELPVFLPLLWWLIERHGALGAALAWLLRMTVDTLAHAAAAAPLLRGSRAVTARGLLVALLAALGFAGLWLDAPAARGAWGLAVVAVAWAIHRNFRLPLGERASA
jgi:O-antigen/teichoic acid export membrane protein